MTQDEREFEARLHELEPAPVPASLKRSLVHAIRHEHADTRPVSQGIGWRTAAAIACMVGLAGLAAGRWTAGMGPGTDRSKTQQDSVVNGSGERVNRNAAQRPIGSDPFQAMRRTDGQRQPDSLAALRSALFQDDLEDQLHKSVEALGAQSGLPPVPLNTDDIMNMTDGAEWTQ